MYVEREVEERPIAYSTVNGALVVVNQIGQLIKAWLRLKIEKVLILTVSVL